MSSSLSPMWQIFLLLSFWLHWICFVVILIHSIPSIVVIHPSIRLCRECCGVKFMFPTGWLYITTAFVGVIVLLLAWFAIIVLLWLLQFSNFKVDIALHLILVIALQWSFLWTSPQVDNISSPTCCGRYNCVWWRYGMLAARGVLKWCHHWILFEVSFVTYMLNVDGEQSLISDILSRSEALIIGMHISISVTLNHLPISCNWYWFFTRNMLSTYFGVDTNSLSVVFQGNPNHNFLLL